MNIDGATIGLALAVIVPAATAIASYATIRERVSRHDRSIEDFGKRIGALEQEARVAKHQLSGVHRIHPGEEA